MYYKSQKRCFFIVSCFLGHSVSNSLKYYNIVANMTRNKKRSIQMLVIFV